MLSPEQFTGFLLAAVLITASPGPDNLMVLGLGVSRGRVQGLVFGLGCALGCLSHTLLAVLGVSALIAASPWAFGLLKVCGGLYLLWLGWQALRSRGGAHISAEVGAQVGAQVGAKEGAHVGAVQTSHEPLTRLFFKGVLANAINPKVVLFFLSFLPQFVTAERGDVPLQMAALGLLFTLQATLLFGALGYFAGAIGQRLNRQPRTGLWLDRVAGAVFVALGLRLILAR